MIDLGLTDRVTLVTGAGVGLGRAVACWLAHAGCDVALVDRDPGPLGDAVEEVHAEGHQARAVTVDLRADGATAAAVDETIASLGGLDVAVDNVGGLAGLGPAPFVAQDERYVHEVVAQNLLVTTACCAAEAQALVAAGRGGGVILNVSSGESARPALGLATYGTAKAAINHLTQTLAVSWRGGRAGQRRRAGHHPDPDRARDALSDEYVATLVTSIPLGRMNEPDDLARLAVALRVRPGPRRDRAAGAVRQRRAPGPQPAASGGIA